MLMFLYVRHINALIIIRHCKEGPSSCLDTCSAHVWHFTHVEERMVCLKVGELKECFILILLKMEILWIYSQFTF